MVTASTLLARTATPTSVTDLVDPGAVFLANYEQAVTLTSNFQTVEQRSRTAANQRYGLQDHPRISISAAALPIKSSQVRVMNDQLLRRTRSRQPFPIYSDSFAITGGTGGAQSTTFEVSSTYDLNYRRIEAQQYVMIAPLRSEEGVGCVDNYVTRKVTSVDKSSTPQTITLDDTLDFTTFGGTTGTGFTPPSLRASDFQGKVTGFTASDTLTSADVLIESGDILVVASCGVGFGGASSTPALATVIAGSAGTTGSAPSLTMTSFGALAGGTTDIDGEEFLPKCQYSRLIITDAIATYLNGMCKTRTAFTHGASDVCSIDHHTFVIKDADTTSPIQDSDTKDVAAGGQSTSTEENFAQTQDNTVEQGTSFFFPKATPLTGTDKLKIGTGSSLVEVKTAGDLSGVSGISTACGTISGCFTATQTSTSDITANFKTDSLGSNNPHRVQCGYLSLKPSNTQLNRLRDSEIQIRVYPAIESESSPTTSLQVIHDELQTVDLLAEQTPGLNALSPVATVANHGRTYKAVYDFDATGSTRNVELPIFDFQINYGAGIDSQETADIDRTDVGLGRESQLFGDHGRRKYDFEILALTRPVAWDFIKFFHSRLGRTVPFWFPMPTTDLKLVTYSGTTLTVEGDIGSAAEVVERGYVCFFTKTGGRAIASIASATDDASGNIVITINKSPSDDVTGTTFDAIVTAQSDISLIKFVSLCTFASDGLTEQWINNEICRMSTSVEELVNERDAESSFELPSTTALTNPYVHDCPGAICDDPDSIIGACDTGGCCVCLNSVTVSFTLPDHIVAEIDACPEPGCKGVSAGGTYNDGPFSACCPEAFSEGAASTSDCGSYTLFRHETGTDGNGDPIYGLDAGSPSGCDYYVFSVNVNTSTCGTGATTLYLIYKPFPGEGESPWFFPDGGTAAAFDQNTSNWSTLYNSHINGCGRSIECQVCAFDTPCDEYTDSLDFTGPLPPDPDPKFRCLKTALASVQQRVYKECDDVNNTGCTEGPCECPQSCNPEFLCEPVPGAVKVIGNGYDYKSGCGNSDNDLKCQTCNPNPYTTRNLDFITGKTDTKNFTIFETF